MSQDIHFNGRRVGVVRGSCFFANVGRIAPDGPFFAEAVLRFAESAGAYKIEVTDRESGNRYHATLALIWAEGRPLPLASGACRQLPLKFWGVQKPDQKEPGLSPAEQEKANQRQLKLF